jgi:hypothetical protein
MLLDNYGPEGVIAPGTFTLVQMHWGDAYDTSWTTARRTFYPGVTGYPIAWFDGVVEHPGAYQNVNQQYNWYLSTYNARQAVPTDVTIQLGAVPTSSSAYDVTAEVCIEEGGHGKTVKIYMAQVIDYYPTSGGYHRNCCMQGRVVSTITLNAGECQRLTSNFTLNATSLARITDVQFIAWAQDPKSSGPAEIYNAGVLVYPFEPLPPECCPCVGDLSDPCNDVVNISDFTLFAAAYGSSVGDLEYNECADLSPPGAPNGVINVSDFTVFSGQFNQPCP